MSSRAISVRNLRFPLDQDGPRYWMAGDRVMSLFLDHLSMVFPPGERFFMRSVRHYESRLSDPQLREAVRAFHAQEALHGREHASYNELLLMRGYPVAAVDRSAKRILGLVERLLPARMQLAVTVSLEHFTALLATFLLADDSILEGAPEELAAMWRWHAAEENEHAAVAFDVFQAVGGTYPERVVVMFFATLLFWMKMIQHQVLMMRADGCLWSGKEWRGLLRFGFRSPGAIPRIWRGYLAFYRPSFHPHELDCSALLAKWQGEFARSPAYAASRAGTGLLTASA